MVFQDRSRLLLRGDVNIKILIRWECQNYLILECKKKVLSLNLLLGDQISRVAKMLADEYGTASNIKSRVNRYG